MLGSTLTTELPRLVRGAGMDTSESDNGVTGRAGTATCLSGKGEGGMERGRPCPRRPPPFLLPPPVERDGTSAGFSFVLGACLA